MTSPTVLGRATMRDHDAPERAATPLELLFDLCFVVAVAFLAAELHHGLAGGHALNATLVYAGLFIPIWWAWMSYTWYATAFSHDDPLTRLLTLLQMGGVLAVAATIPHAVTGEMLPFAIAYAAMRFPLLLQWVRSGLQDSAHRAFAYTYAVGYVLAQVLWVGGSVVSGAPRWATYVVALAVELATPVLAVRRAPGRVFHAGHIAERYGLFTIIVLGETVLAVAVGLRDSLNGEGAAAGSASVVVAAALVIAFGMWWLYFDALGRDGLTRNRRAAFVWGYGHYLVFAAVAAVGAGVQAQLEVAAHAGEEGYLAAWVAVPLATALAAVAWLQVAANHRLGEAARPLAGAAVCLMVLPAGTGLPIAVADALLAGVVLVLTLRQTWARAALLPSRQAA